MKNNNETEKTIEEIKNELYKNIKKAYYKEWRKNNKDKIKNDETSFIYIPNGMFSFTPTFDIISSVKV